MPLNIFEFSLPHLKKVYSLLSTKAKKVYQLLNFLWYRFSVYFILSFILGAYLWVFCAKRDKPAFLN